MLVLILIVPLLMLPAEIKPDCQLNVARDFNARSPLLLDTRDFDFLRPKSSDSAAGRPSSPNNKRHRLSKAPITGTLTLKSDETHRLFCPDGHILIGADDPRPRQIDTNDSTAILHCQRNSKLKIGQAVRDFQNVSCSKEIDAVTRETPHPTCPQLHVEIGFNLTAVQAFRKTLDVCYDERTATSIWAHALLPHSILDGKQSGGAAPSFRKGDYFKNVKISKVYSVASQHETLLALFDGNETLANRYLPKRGANYMVKGHLVPRADKFYYAEQNSTFFYLNVLPMWQTINNGNWKICENAVRRTASAIGDLEIWTGAIGVLVLSGKPIYLALDKRTNQRVLPTPKLLFKLAFSRDTRQGIVFITANNPYLTNDDELSDYIICKDKVHNACQNEYPKFKDFVKGYTYCCLYKDFIAVPAVTKLGLPNDFGNIRPLPIA